MEDKNESLRKKLEYSSLTLRSKRLGGILVFNCFGVLQTLEITLQKKTGANSSERPSQPNARFRN